MRTCCKYIHVRTFAQRPEGVGCPLRHSLACSLTELEARWPGTPDPLISVSTVLELQVIGLHTGFCLDSEDLNSGLAQCVLLPLSYVPFPICHPSFASMFPSHLLCVDFTQAHGICTRLYLKFNVFPSIKEAVHLTACILNQFHISFLKQGLILQARLAWDFPSSFSQVLRSQGHTSMPALLFYLHGSFPSLCYPLHVGTLLFPQS